MLGYVVTFKPEMKVKEAELYKAYYCGVCKSIGRRYGQLPRFILSFDAAFLSTVLDGFFPHVVEFQRERCIAHPHKKEPIARCHAIDFAGDIMLILAWYKALDDIHDEGSKKALAFSKAFRGKFNKLKAEHPNLCMEIQRILSELSHLEDTNCNSIDRASEAFAKIMEAIFTEGLSYIYCKKIEEGTLEKSEEWDKKIQVSKIVLARVGYHLGKWIYLMDAFDDIEENIESGAYNPLLYRFDYKKGENPLEFRNRIRKDVERNLVIYLSEMGKAFDLADLKKNRGIIENVVYVGLLKKTEEILQKGLEESKVKNENKSYN